MKKIEIWGFKIITTQNNLPIEETLIVSGLDETNNLLNYSFSKQEILYFFSVNYPNTSLTLNNINQEIIKELIDYYELKW